MRYRVYGMSGCLGEFVAFRYELAPESHSNIRAFAYGCATSVDILYQEPIVTIKDGHGNIDYIAALRDDGPASPPDGGASHE